MATPYTAHITGDSGACEELLSRIPDLDYSDAVAVMIESDHGYAQWCVSPIYRDRQTLVAIIDDSDNCRVRLIQASQVDDEETRVETHDFPYPLFA